MVMRRRGRRCIRDGCGAARFREKGLAILGDNVAALQLSLSLKGKGSLNTISREIALHRCREGWHYAVGHISAGDNQLADALSRTAAPQGSDRKVKPSGFKDLRREHSEFPRSAWDTVL